VVETSNGSPVHLPPPDMIITTDASKKGWGAVHQSLQTNGRWSQKESLQHINYPELKASFLALKTFLKGRSHVTASLQLDNTTAIAYINIDWCQERDILVIASHIPGRDNISADKESREFKDMSEPGEVGPNNNSAFSAYLSDRSVCESSNQPTR